MTGADVLRDSNGRASREYLHALFDCSPLPVELVVRILDLAEIWHRIEETPFLHEGVLTVHNARQVVSATPPLSSAGIHCLRRIIFRVTAGDQGWSSESRVHHGTFERSWTWHDAELTVEESPTGRIVSKGVFELQRNRHASKNFADYCLVLNQDHDIFGAISPGCSINLVSGAIYPGWLNRVQHASIELQFFDMFAWPELQFYQTDTDGQDESTTQGIDVLGENLRELSIR